MRTRSAAERATIKAARVEHHLWVEVENKDRTFIDVSSWIESAEWGESIDQPTGTFTVRFRRDDETASLAPAMGGSTLNRDDLGAFAPLLHTGRNIKIWTAVVDPGVDPTTKKKLAFWGRIDRVSWNTTPIEVTGRDLGGWIVDAFIQQERVIGRSEGDPIETLMAQVLANDPVFGTPTLYTPTSPGFIVANPTGAKQSRKSVMEALQQDYALSLGWACRYVFDNGTDTPRLTFFDIDRTKTIPDDEFDADEYEDITSLEVSDADVRNFIVGTYYDTAGKQHARTVQNATSQADYGVKFMQIDLALGDPIDTDAEMDAMLNAAVNDLGAPLTTQEMLTLYYWPVQLGDLYNFKANNNHYDSDQKLAVVAYTHKFENGEGKTSMQCRGSVVGAYHAWFRHGIPRDGSGSGSDVLPQIQQVSVSFPAGTVSVDVLLRGNVAVGSWRVALSTTAQPDLAATRAAAIYSGQNVNALITQTVFTGQKLYISVLAYSGATGSGAESDLFQSYVTRDGVGGPILPVPQITPYNPDFDNAGFIFDGKWTAGAPLPHEFRYAIWSNIGGGPFFVDWADAAFLPFDTGIFPRLEKSATYITLQVRQGSDDASIVELTYELAGTDPATGNDGLIKRDVPYDDGGFALKATDTGGFIADPGATDDRLRPLTDSFQYGVDTLLGVVDGDGYARVPFDGSRFNLADVTMDTLDLGDVSTLAAALLRVGGAIRATGEVEAADFVLTGAGGGSPGSPGVPVAVYDEGVQLTPEVTSLKFVGAGVSASAVGSDVTVTIGDFLTQAAGDARYSQLGHTHTFASLTSKPTTIGGYGITDFNSLGDARWAILGASLNSFSGMIAGGFGAGGTGGTLDWNDATNARSGQGNTLLQGNATNGPLATAGFFHSFSWEYASKNGSGNLTQMAIPYGDDVTRGMWMRGRYAGTWGSWKRFAFWTDLTWTNLLSKPTTIGGYGITDFNSLGDARWRRLGSTVVLSGSINPYVQFNDGTYNAYWQMASGAMGLYHNGADRINVSAAGDITITPYADVLFAGARPITVSSGLGFVRMKGNASGWAMFYGFMGSAGTDLGGFGAYGGGNALSYYYIGTYGVQIEATITPGTLFDIKYALGVAGAKVIDAAGSYNQFWDKGASVIALHLGNAADPTNYYSNTAHYFRGRTGTQFALLNGGGLELMPGSASVVTPNGGGFYARRTTSNAVIRCMGYDAGTDDLTTVMGGNIWRVRDTGSGVIMSLSWDGAMKVTGGSNAFWVTDRGNSAQQYAFYSTGGYGILWTSQGIDAVKIAYSTGAANFVSTVTATDFVLA